MELSDGVVVLRPPTEADADDVFDNVVSSRAELAPFMPWATETYSRDDALTWIGLDTAEEWSQLITVDGATVGSCGLNRFDQDNQTANLGYWVRTDATGHGFATRATRLLALHGLAEHGLARVEIYMSTENAASRRVAERAGARFEGTMRSRLLLHGRHHDAHLFSFVEGDLTGC